MPQLNTGFVDSTRLSGGVPASVGPLDEPVNFRFMVTWSCLAVSADPARWSAHGNSAAPRIAPPLLQTVPVEAPQVVALPSPPALFADPAAVAHAPIALVASKSPAERPLAVPKKSAGGFQWEMVVPKMVRMPKKAAPRRAAAVNSPPVETEPPNLYTTSSSGILKSFSFKFCLGVIAAVAIAIPLWRRAAHPAFNTVQTAFESGDWLRESAVGGDPGVKRGRQLLLYRPALNTKDSRLEFAWTVASGDVGLVFRAKDLGNYYAVRLKLLKPGPTPTLAAEFSSVYQFVERPHTEKVLVFSKNDPVLLVRLDIFGPQFTLYLQDNATEFWTDARMTSGAFGFFEEFNKPAEVRGLRMSFPERSQLRRRPLEEILPSKSAMGGAY